MTKGKNGRPVKEFKWEVLDGVLQYGATLIDCSELMGLSEDTIQNRIKKDYKMTFSEYRQKKMGKMRMKLLQKQYETAMNGNVVMLIFLGKNHLGQADKIETENKNDNTITLAYQLPEKEKPNS